MKKAFTMIELIFVIVIIGILAAVALPKLAATRDDAKISGIITNAKITLRDFQGYYTSRGNSMWQIETVNRATSVPLETTACGTYVTTSTPLSENTFMLCNDNVVCLTFNTIDEGNLSILDGVETTDRICEAVKRDPAIRAISNKSHKLGGETVLR